MAFHFIIYSKATGRVRRVIVENPPPIDPVAYANKLKLTSGEALITYGLKDEEKQLKDTAIDWQAIVSAETGSIPTNDRYAIVNQDGEVVGSLHADLACGDAVNDCALVPHDKADDKWIYDYAKQAFIEPLTATFVAEPSEDKATRLREMGMVIDSNGVAVYKEQVATEMAVTKP